MFQLTKEEFENWKSQFAIYNYDEDMSSQIAMTSDENLKSQIATSSGEEKWKSQIATSNAEENMSPQNATTYPQNMSPQIATTSPQRRPASALPYAFTENGIAMLSGVLRSPMAIATNIRIMRAFNAMRHFIGSHAQVFQRIEVLERTQLSLVAFKEETNRNFEEVFRRLDDNSEKPEKGIFYDGQIFDAYTFINEHIREAKKRIVLIDNYVDDSVLTMLDKRNKDADFIRIATLLFQSHKIAQWSDLWTICISTLL